jgi:hypothetical protein
MIITEDMLYCLSLVIHSFKSNKYDNVSDIIEGNFICFVGLLAKSFYIHWCTENTIIIKLFICLLDCNVSIIWIGKFTPIMEIFKGFCLWI